MKVKPLPSRKDFIQNQIWGTNFGYDGRELELAIRMFSLGLGLGYDEGELRGKKEGMESKVEKSERCCSIAKCNNGLTYQISLCDLHWKAFNTASKYCGYCNRYVLVDQEKTDKIKSKAASEIGGEGE